MITTHIHMNQLLPAWKRFNHATGIASINNETHYQQMVALLEALLEQTAGNEQHPAMELVDIVGDLLAAYESDRRQLPKSTSVQALLFLMEQHKLQPSDLTEIGEPTLVTEILADRQKLDIQQIQALSKRFGVTLGTFID